MQLINTKHSRFKNRSYQMCFVERNLQGECCKQRVCPGVLRESTVADTVADKKMLKHQKNLRIGRFSQPNQIYHITFTTKNRAPILKNLTNARTFINIIKQSDQLKHTTTLAFVVMPDHIHWLFQLGDNHQLHNLIKTIKSQASIQIGQPIWQSGYYDHALRKDEDIVNIARYIIANPIRAGLVKKAGDYPHWDAVWL